MKYLLDTCILRELLSQEPAQALLNWLIMRTDQELFISAFSLAQLHRGTGLLNELRRSSEIIEWLEKVESGFGSRIVPFTGNTAQFWAMLAQNRKAERLQLPESYIYASAIEHGMCLVTRHNDLLGELLVQYFDPWDPLKTAQRKG